MEKFDNSDQILRAMKNITTKAKGEIDILFGRHILKKEEIG